MKFLFESMLFFMVFSVFGYDGCMAIPLLFISDAVSATTGLARITRHLAVRLHTHCSDVFDVAAVGYGAAGKRDLPIKEYHLHSLDKWLVPELPDIYDDWTQGRDGILMVCWDASRLYWLGKPETCPIPHLRRFAERKDVKKWLYPAIDAEGPNGKLPSSIAETVKGFDRVIEYSQFASNITGNPDWLPHGIDCSVFKPYPKKESRAEFAAKGFQGLTQDSLCLGIVSTNQTRKNWALGFQTAKLLLDRGHDVRVWAHCDVLERYWSIPNLVVDYGLVGRVAVTQQRFTDDEMARLYSTCDVTLGIGPEGFGYPIAESLACGVPVVTGNYAAQAEFVPAEMLIEPITFYYEGAFCSKRPVFNPADWAERVEAMALKYGQVSRTSLLPERLDWANLWEHWERWFRNGVQ